MVGIFNLCGNSHRHFPKGEVGPEFSFSAVITFEGSACYGSRLFDFCNGIEAGRGHQWSSSLKCSFLVNSEIRESRCSDVGLMVPSNFSIYSICLGSVISLSPANLS